MANEFCFFPQRSYLHRRARRRKDEGVFCLRVRVELLTEVTLGLLLHSGDGTVLVCEEKLLELGDLIL